MFSQANYIIYYFIFIFAFKIQIIQTSKTQLIKRKLNVPPYVVTLTFEPDLSNKLIFNDYHPNIFSNIKAYVIKEDNSREEVTSYLELLNSKKIKYNQETNYSKLSLEFQTKLTTFREMFFETNVASVVFEESFQTLNVNDMEGLFRKCGNLKSVDVSNLNTLDLTDMSRMFDNCLLLSFLDLSNFKPVNLVNTNYMFNRCKSLLSLDLSNFIISKSSDFSEMFSSCNFQYIKFFNLDTLNLLRQSPFTFIGFSKCSGCINSNTDKYCEINYNNQTLYFFYKKSQLNDNEKECYWFEGVEKCPYLKDSEIRGIETNLNNITCDECNNLFGYYPLEKDINNTYYDCYKQEDLPNYYLYKNGNVKYFKMCDVSCSNCTEDSEKCIQCNLNYYKLNENKEQNSNCYNETTKPTNYFLNENDKYYEKCDISCDECKYENNKCEQCNLGFYRLEDKQELYSYCYNETTKPLNYYFDKNLNYFKKCHSDCESCIESANSKTTNCITCTNKKHTLFSGNCINIIEITCKNEKCKKCNEISNTLNLCLECDINKGYFPIYELNSFYIDCYSTKPKKHYLDLNTKSYKECFETCKSCDFGGNKTENNCTECANNYMFIKDFSGYEKNCFYKCDYFYYFSLESDSCFYQYVCTDNYQCPMNYSLLYAEEKQCLKKCTDHNSAIYQYNGECFINCPEGTINDENNICRENINKCKVYETNFNIPLEKICEENILIFLKNYANEFDYTNKHISIYKNINYIITLYRDFECFNELDLNISKVDLTECLSKVEEYYDLTKDNIVAITINILLDNSTKLLYFIYDTKNFNQLQISPICNEKITLFKNILQIPNINSKLSQYIFNQNINLFDITEPFYNDICYHFDSVNNKDVALKDRFSLYYPNISICEDECENIGVNFTSMSALCKCDVEDCKYNLLDEINDEELNEIREKIKSTNLIILKCYKDLLDLNLFLKNIGGFLILAIIFIQIVCTLFFVLKDLKVIKNFISNIIKKFEHPKTKNNKNNSKIKKNISQNITKKKINKSKLSQSMAKSNSPPKKNKKKKNNSCIEKSNNVSKIIIEQKNNDNPFTQVIGKKNNKFIYKGKNKRNNEVKIIPSNIIKSNSSLANLYEKENFNRGKQNINKVKIKIDDIIEESIDEMDYYAALEKDKRSFCRIFLDKIQDNLQIINIFIYNNIIPRSLRILLLIIKIDIYFVINGLFYNDTYISELFFFDEKETFFTFIRRSVARIVYTSLVSTIVEFLIDYFYPEETHLRSLLINTKNSLIKLKANLLIFLEKTKNNYIAFICISYFITIFSWYYVSCFNNVYPHTKYEWIKSSVIICFIMQIKIIIKCSLYALLRILSIKWKTERFFKMSKNFS